MLRNNYGIVNHLLIEEYTFLIVATGFLPECIDHLKKIKETDGQKAFDFTVEFMLWNFKYKINNAIKKTILRCRIEKKIKEKSISEIGNLYKMMSIY